MPAQAIGKFHWMKKAPTYAPSILDLGDIDSRDCRFEFLLPTISFKQIMTEMFEDLQGVEVMVDDILVWGTNQKEHDERLKKVLQRAKQRNLKQNKEKSQISLNKIHYFGHTHQRWN